LSIRGFRIGVPRFVAGSEYAVLAAAKTFALSPRLSSD
jgi:hypothetical protein